jgi:hypothetical protein
MPEILLYFTEKKSLICTGKIFKFEVCTDFTICFDLELNLIHCI